MKEVLTPIEITSNYEFLIKKLKSVTSGEKQKNCLALYDSLEERIAIAPASSVIGFHGCYPGGYVKHVLTVVRCAETLYNTWSDMGADMDGYDLNELLFAAINHDLGKIGSFDEDYYKPNPSEWHVKNQGKVYIHNPDLTNMLVPDRSLFLLQQYGVQITENEYIAIKIHDGLFEEANKSYWITWDPGKKFKNNMPIILHHADYMSFRIEFEEERKMGLNSVVSSTPTTKKTSQSSVTNSTGNASTIFDKMFNED